MHPTNASPYPAPHLISRHHTGPLTNGGTAAKFRQKENHKNNEKRRRDESGAMLQLGFGLCSFDPGVLTNCQFCNTADSTSSSVASPTIDPTPAEPNPSTSFTSSAASTTAPADPPKITKNEKQDELVNWGFSVLVHYEPACVPRFFRAARAQIAQAASDKKRSAAKPRKVRNLDADVKVEVTVEALARMEELCARHGVRVDGDEEEEMEEEAEKGRGKRKRRDGSGGADEGRTLTPPSSRGSPMGRMSEGEEWGKSEGREGPRDG